MRKSQNVGGVFLQAADVMATVHYPSPAGIYKLRASRLQGNSALSPDPIDQMGYYLDW